MNEKLPSDYPKLLRELKQRIQGARVRAALAANAELIHLYWDIGRLIVEQQEKQGWGKSVVERLSADLASEFPDQGGLSPANLWRMRQFYSEWNQASAILAQSARELLGVLSQVPWFTNVQLFTKVKDPRERYWYALQTIENGWSRAVLTVQIESGLYQRQGGAASNFERTLPAPDSDLAQEVFKDSYVLDFVGGESHRHERGLEKELTTRITDFLLELGKGFAFVGRQYRLDVGGDEFFIDLLFYHLRLHCYVVIDLKMRKFQPSDAGQINFYLEAIDRQVRDPKIDGRSIGLILCKEKNSLVVEYALARAQNPAAVATWEISHQLPEELKDELPTAEQLAEKLADQD